MIGQNSLNNFYQSVKFSNPLLAARMSDDIVNVALNALSFDKTPGNESARRLREQSQELPEALRRVLDNALIDLGY